LTTIRGQESAGQSTMAAVGSTHDVLAREQSGKFTRPSSAEVPVEMFAGCTSDTEGCKPHGCMVVSELVYVNHYRDNSSVEKLRSTVLNFYSAAEITDAKKKLINVFNQALPSDCPFRTERRKSSARAAQEAEVNDIIGIFDIIDRQHKKLFTSVKFAVRAIDRIPKYGPEETNIATMVDKQITLEAVVSDLASQIDSVRA
jgi:hypothetical protein